MVRLNAGVCFWLGSRDFRASMLYVSIRFLLKRMSMAWFLSFCEVRVIRSYPYLVWKVCCRGFLTCNPFGISPLRLHSIRKNNWESMLAFRVHAFSISFCSRLVLVFKFIINGLFKKCI